MPTQAFGLYPAEGTAGDEVSSTYEGRQITLTAAELLTSDGSGVATKGLPCVFGIIAGNIGVGVCLKTGTTTDLIAIDTEGIWDLSVVASDDDGDVLVTGGDRIYINTTTGILSRISNAVTQIPFGYALGQVLGGTTAVIAVKVHFDSPLTGGADLKSIDHVQGTTSDPIVWGTDTSNIKTMTFTVADGGGYISGQRFHGLTADDLTGGVYGIYGRLDIKHDVQNMDVIHALGYVVPTVAEDLAINQVLAISGQVYLNNPGKTATIADQMTAVRATIDQEATSVLATGNLVGVMVYMEGAHADNSGRTMGIEIYQGGGGDSYPDYGIYITMESEHTLAGIKIDQLAVGAGWGIQLHDSGGFGYDALFAYTGVNAQGYFLWLTTASGVEDTAIPFDTATCDQTADRRLRVRCEGDTADRYIYLFPI